jgi:MoaA/NifB/PqqE/SkfB family radical SAM enzyme
VESLAVPRVLFDHYIAGALHGGKTAFHALAEIDLELSQVPHSGAAVALVNRKRRSLCELLATRFPAVAAQALTLRTLNLLLARYHFRARNAWLASRPFGLVVDPSNMCRLACPGCVHSARSEALQLFDWHKGTLTEDRFSALLRACAPWAVGIYFCDYGEPLLNLNTPKLIRQAKQYLLSTALSTSLSVRRFDAEAYVESGLDFMVLSIDGATQPVYERFRRNGNLELVLENVRRLVSAKRKLGKRTPVLSWNFLAFEHNVHEIPEARRMARRLGVNQFRVVNPFAVSWDEPDIQPARIAGRVHRFDWQSITNMPGNWNPFPEEMQAEAIGQAFEKGWAAGAASESPGIPGHTCHWLYKNMVMDATGRVLPCCGAPRPDTNLVFGQFSGNGADPFNSERYVQARLFFRGAMPPADSPPHCVDCDWDQTVVNIGGPEIRRYFRAADPAFFNRKSVRLLSDW